MRGAADEREGGESITDELSQFFCEKRGSHQYDFADGYALVFWKMMDIDACRLQFFSKQGTDPFCDADLIDFCHQRPPCYGYYNERCI
ncbi:MAG: hypothetical protein AAB533_00765 [Patescibacteria group bacterium]